MTEFAARWVVDFEFHAPPGERPKPLCLVAMELNSKRLIRLWLHGQAAPPLPPYDLGSSSLMIAYYASAEMGCHRALGWPAPKHLLDLFAEFRNQTNGRHPGQGTGLNDALAYYGLPTVNPATKEAMRQRAIMGGPFTASEQQELMDYCESDVRVTAQLYQHVIGKIHLGQARLRGCYMDAVAAVEWNGIPVDTDSLKILTAKWDLIRRRLVEELDPDGVIFPATKFNAGRFIQLLVTKGIPWPQHDSGRLKLDQATFSDMVKIYPDLRWIYELLKIQGKMRPGDLSLGADGRNRCLLSPFQSLTSRNQPSGSRFIFGLPAWLRHLIRPEPGMGLAYLDWSQQEFGVAAALSRDPAMMQAYLSGDPYLAFARQAGAVPLGATKESHPTERGRFKQCILAVQYCMGVRSLALRLGQSEAHAQQLLELHHHTFPDYWRWSEAVVNRAGIHCQLQTCFGWTLHCTSVTKGTTVRNFLIQAHGAEMMRLAVTYAVQAGVRVCAPVHDAILIEAPLGQLKEQVQLAASLMARASREVLEELELRTDVQGVTHPGRFQDSRGTGMWERIQKIVTQSA